MPSTKFCCEPPQREPSAGVSASNHLPEHHFPDEDQKSPPLPCFFQSKWCCFPATLVKLVPEQRMTKPQRILSPPLSPHVPFLPFSTSPVPAHRPGAGPDPPSRCRLPGPVSQPPSGPGAAKRQKGERNIVERGMGLGSSPKH